MKYKLYDIFKNTVNQTIQNIYYIKCKKYIVHTLRYRKCYIHQEKTIYNIKQLIINIYFEEKYRK